MSKNDDIKYIARDKLDVKKYDACISSAIQNGAYAFSWFLDIICDNWDILVLNDYEAVMPLPKRKKYFIPYIYTPPFVQQLGVFSKNEVSPKLIQLFLKSIPAKFKIITNNFNAGNTFKSEHLSTKQNYILNLNQNYAAINKKYKKGRKSSLSQAKKNDLVIKPCPPELIINTFIKEKGTGLSLNKKDYKRLLTLITYCIDNRKGETLGVFDCSNNFIGGSFFLHSSDRIIYLFSATTEKGRKLNAITLLIDFTIKKNASSNYIFDFEGSMIPGIASFFKSFGAKTEDYYLFYKKLHLYQFSNR